MKSSIKNKAYIRGKHKSPPMKVRLSLKERVRILNSTDLYPIMQKILLRQGKIRRRKEYFWVVGLENDNTINFIELIGMGSVNWVSIEPREVFRISVIKNVPKVILVHNHVSPNLRPSNADVDMTSKLNLSSKLLGIKVLDHLIISEKKYLSFADEEIDF